jgi:hypothetical protein
MVCVFVVVINSLKSTSASNLCSCSQFSLGEFGEVFPEDTVQALELLSEPANGKAAVQCCHISLQAVSGGEANETIRLRAQVGNQVMITLIDSGSSHSFINQEFALLSKCQIKSAPAAHVKLANGSLVLS